MRSAVITWSAPAPSYTERVPGPSVECSGLSLQSVPPLLDKGSRAHLTFAIRKSPVGLAGGDGGRHSTHTCLNPSLVKLGGLNLAWEEIV